MKSVVHIITTAERGGAENQLLILVEAQVRKGREVLVIPLKGKLELIDSFRDVGAEIATDWIDKSVFQQIRGIRKALRLRQAIVHAHLPRSEMLSIFISRRKDLIISRHNAEPFFPGAPSWLSRALSRFVTYGSTSVVAISDAVKEFLFASGEVAPSKFVSIVEYGFPKREEQEINAETQRLRNELQISDSELVVGTIGRLVQQKDYPTLIAGFAKFLDLGFDSKLIVLGEGDLKQHLVALSVNLGIEEKVIWLGKKENVFSYLELMDVFVLASKYEGFGLVLLEAMSINLPIIAARNPAVEQVLEANYPWLFDIGDANQLATHLASMTRECNRRESILHGDRRLGYFSVERMVKKMDACYENH
jgi:glycosyltransferase involved in cell wall biosynthesis